MKTDSSMPLTETIVKREEEIKSELKKLNQGVDSQLKIESNASSSAENNKE